MRTFCPRSWAWGLRHRERAARPVCSSSSRMLGECIAGHIPPGALQRQRLVLRLALIERVPLSFFRGKGLSCASWTVALFDSLGARGAETCAAVQDILSTHPLPLPPCSLRVLGFPPHLIIYLRWQPQSRFLRARSQGGNFVRLGAFFARSFPVAAPACTADS